MTITKNSLIIMIFLLTTKRSLAQSANSQQPTANSQQPTANSQQVVLTKIIFNFGIYAILRIRAVSDFFRSLFFYVLLVQFVMLNLFQHPDSETSSL